MNGNNSKSPTTPPLPLRGTSPKGGSEGLDEFALVHSDWYSAYRRKPLRLTNVSRPQLCMKQLYAVEDGYTC